VTARSELAPEVAPPTRPELPPWLCGDLEVLDVLASRREGGSLPGNRHDSHQVALVVEGGGMRGAYVGGMVHALHTSGFRHTFDRVFAVSAGAFSVAGLLAGNTDHAVSAYAEDLVRGGFVDWRRYLTRRGPLITLDLLVDEIMGRRIGFDFESLSHTAPVLEPIATDLETLTSVALTGMRTAEDWRLALRASATVPLFAGPPVTWRGRRYVDGFVADALPLARAIAAGATHVLALVARPPGEELRVAGPRTHALSSWAYDRVAPGLGALMAGRAPSYAESLAILSDPAHRHRGDAKVLAIRPTHGTGVASLTSDPDRLWAAGESGEAAVRSAFLSRPLRDSCSARPAGADRPA
jgi:predicted patatin/cPLA2 family phospholipase